MNLVARQQSSNEVQIIRDDLVQCLCIEPQLPRASGDTLNLCMTPLWLFHIDSQTPRFHAYRVHRSAMLGRSSQRIRRVLSDFKKHETEHETLVLGF